MVYVTHDQTEAMTLGDRVAVMRLGTIQQVASPEELYDRPVNLFVAGFIGSPAMNFMAGTLEDGKLRTGLGDITLTGRMRQEVESSGTGRDVIVGIRPEDFEDASFIAADVKPKGLTFHADIDVIESLGAEKYVYFTRELGQTGNVAELEELARDAGRADISGTAETVVARLDPATRIREGQDAELWVDVRKVHVFDPANGRNLSLAARGDADGGTVQAGSAGAAASQAPPSQAPPSEASASQATADPADSGQAPASPPPPAAPAGSAPAGSGQSAAGEAGTSETAPGGEAT
jgi:multiple sugar transport system ATP-binding protein